MGVRWYRLLPDHSLEDGPEIENAVGFAAYSDWLYGLDENGNPTRWVAQTDVTDDIHVSTVFLGLDHKFGDGPPVVFETLVMGGDRDGDGRRYCTWDEALAGHKEICSSISSGLSRDELEAAKKVILSLLRE